MSIVSPYKVLIPGQAPPPVTAYCQLCDLPCYRQWLDIVTTDADWIGIHCECCGQHSSSRIRWSAFQRMKATQAKWYAIVRKGLTPGVRDMSKRSFQGIHG